MGCIMLWILPLQPAPAQNKPVVSGFVTDQEGNLLEGVNIWSKPGYRGTMSDAGGHYSIMVPPDMNVTLFFSYQNSVKKYNIPLLEPGSNFKLNVLLTVNVRLSTTTIKGTRPFTKPERIPMEKVDTRVLEVLPTTGEKVITIIKSLPGVSSNTELSSGYTVRGGNYDENLVYINGIEIYRPFIIRSGQQEGLPIINSNLVDGIKFSAGGFEAKYGDKMSSVLDITYKTPKKFAGSASLNLLGRSAHLEGASEGYRFKYLMGFRQWSNSYFLNSLDVEGEYKTKFTDFQSLLSYDLDDKVTLSWFSYYGQNKYNLIPETQTTDYGTHDLVLRFKVYFDGQELTQYENILNALTVTFKDENDLVLKAQASAYVTHEGEYFDIMGQYWLDQVDKDPGSESFDSTKVNLGIGTFLNHARNTLNATIINVSHSGEKKFDHSDLVWGVKAQSENIRDKLREWSLIDSAGYIIPLNSEALTVNDFVSTRTELFTFRYSGYLQNTFLLNDTARAFLTTGIRSNYWTYNNEFIITPRIQFVFEPTRKNILRNLTQHPDDTVYHKKVQLKFAAGMYYQPPFYRELRDREGILNPNIVSQKSYHLLAGADVYFKMWGRLFKWTSEAYFKYLDDIIPYDFDDVRIRYYATNNAVGYAMGLDMQIYGEFVKGLPSWANISLMQTRENVDNDYQYVRDDNGLRIYDSTAGLYLTEPRGFLPRPTDQRLRVAIFFQDFLPKNPNSKVNLNFVFGTPIPFGPPQFETLRNRFRMRSYKRVDVGFSRLLYSAEKNTGPSWRILKHVNSVWGSAEIFNMFGVRNVISYFWVKDVNNNYWGVPNYLTRRRFNVNLTVNF